MKLASLRTYFGERLVVPDVLGSGRLLDLQAAYARQLELGGLRRDAAVRRAGARMPNDLVSLLEDDPSLALPRGVLQWVRERADLGHLDAHCSWPADRDQIGPPIPRPRKVWAMGGNYSGHRREMAARSGAVAAPGPPRGFLKATTSLIGPYDDVVYPPESHHVDHEMELAFVIGRRCRRVNPRNAMDHVAGYLAFVDVSARDIAVLDDHRNDRGKGFDTFGVMGPWFATADEIPDPHDLSVRFWVNDEARQDGSTRDMITRIPEIIAWLTTAMTLEPGDIVCTGTCEGVGAIHPGDRLRGEVQGLGVVENRVVAETVPA